MPESISAGEAEFGRRALYVRDINNWIKAGRACTSGSLPLLRTASADSTLNASRRDARARTCLRLPLVSATLPPPSFRRPSARPADNFLIAELDVAGGDPSD